MKKSALILVLASALSAAGLLAPTPCRAQTFPPGSFSIDGIPVSCNAVWTVLNPNLGDAGHAYPAANGNPPIIALDPTIVSNFPTPVKLFMYAHECGHHMIGANEGNADCWAVQTGKRQRWFTQADMQFLVNVFAWNPGDWTHAPGPIRLQNIWQCFVAA